MKHGTIKTLGVTALGAAFAVAGSGAASAAGLTDTVEGASGSILTTPQTQQVGANDTLGRLTPEPAKTLPAKLLTGENGSGTLGNLSNDNAAALLGGMPVVNQVTGSSGGLTSSGVPLG